MHGYFPAAGYRIEATAEEVDLVFKSILPSKSDGLLDGTSYDIYIKLEDGHKYQIERGEDGAILLWNNEKIKILDEPIILTVCESIPIECVYKTETYGFDTVNLKTLYNLFLKLTSDTRGEVEISLETEKSTLKKKIFVGSPISFDSWSFGNASFSAPFKSTQLVKSFLRGFEGLAVEIKSSTSDKFGLEEISFVYLKSPKTKRI